MQTDCALQDESMDGSDTGANTKSIFQEQKVKHMSDAETSLLLDLIANSQALHYKSTKSAVNQLKAREWHRIAKLFNSRTNVPRTVKQIQLKWDNLKKFAKQHAADRAKYTQSRNIDVAARVLNIINNPKPYKESHTNKIETDNIKMPDIMIPNDVDSNKDNKTEDMIKIKKQKITSNSHPHEENNLYFEGSSSCSMDMHENRDGYTTDSSDHEKIAPGNTAFAEYFMYKKKIAEAKLNRILLENEKLKLEIDLLRIQIRENGRGSYR